MDGIKPPPKAGARVVEPSISVIVTLAPGSANAAWLSAWKEQLAGLEVLIVPAAGGSANVALPAGFEGAKVVAAPPAGVDGSKLSGREIALLTAKGPRVLFLAEGSTPATTPKGEVVQLVKEHTYNLSTPATPFFFNTLYDPFRTGADFVRGYPFSLRDGVKTAVSHGLALGGTARYVDATLTLPKQAWAVLSPSNLAIDKSLLGIASYNGLDAAGKPLDAATDNSWSSLTIKALANHLGYGVKTGLPYVASSSKAAAEDKTLPSARFEKEILAFFQGVQLSAASTTSEAAYLELASLVKAQLGPVDAFFVQQAAAMEAWAKAFKAAASA